MGECFPTWGKENPKCPCNEVKQALTRYSEERVIGLSVIDELNSVTRCRMVYCRNIYLVNVLCHVYNKQIDKVFHKGLGSQSAKNGPFSKTINFDIFT